MKLTPIQRQIESLTRVDRPCGITRVASKGETTPEAQRVIFAESIAGAVIHRINFPKVKAGKVSRKASLEAKVRPLLSPDEQADARQTVALVLVATGAFDRMRLTLSEWKEVFRAVRGSDCLRIDRRAKNQSEIVRVDTLSEAGAEMAAIREGLPELPAVRRKVLARLFRYMRAQMFAAHRADTSRKQKYNLTFARRFMRFMLSHYSRNGAFGFSDVGITGNDSSRLRHAHEKFRAYLAAGEALLTAESLADIPAKVTREFRAFADIPANYAIGD